MADAYRPRKQPARDRPPPLADRITFGADNGNNSRPANHNGDIAAGYQEFTFSSGNGAPQFPPTGPSSERNTRRTRGGAPGKYNERHYGRGVDSTSYQNGRNNAGASRRGNYRKPPAAHERALLQSRDDTTEQSFVTYGSNKFNLDNISVDEELDQDSDADDSDDAAVGGGVRKVARVHSKVSADGDSVPKWSNPDPYTVLPPPETAKRVDVVKLIRKAKNDAAEQNNNGNAVAANDDFISFMPDDQLEAPLNDLPDPALIPTATPQKSNGRRKRVRDEVGVAKEWQTTRIGNTPWVKNGYEHLKQNPAKWLHNEILDFYDMVVPGEHDTAVRCRLIQRVSTAIGRKLSQFDWPEASTQCFGSFPTGLYLPVADMDLVYISDYHYQGGHPQITTSNAKLWKIGHILESKGIAADLTVIGKAKVPIIKFVDRLTGLPVDISFEQRGGIDAQYYFSKWQNDFPDLRYLVALVKQLLLMHKLNEVNSGGLGGFSIICLVAFFLHETVKDESLGTMFLQFLDYYGKFDLSRHRIVMVPPSLQPKGHIGIDGRPEKVGRLSIQDPTNPENNISGGSSEIQRIFTLFRTTHDTLRDRMNAIRNDLPYNSILEPVLGGNYTPYADYRERMDKLKEKKKNNDDQSCGSAPMSIDTEDNVFMPIDSEDNVSMPIEIGGSAFMPIEIDDDWYCDSHCDY